MISRERGSGLSVHYKLVQALALNKLQTPKQLQEQVFPELPKAELDDTDTFKWPLRQMRIFSDIIGIGVAAVGMVWIQAHYTCQALGLLPPALCCVNATAQLLD